MMRIIFDVERNKKKDIQSKLNQKYVIYSLIAMS